MSKLLPVLLLVYLDGSGRVAGEGGVGDFIGKRIIPAIFRPNWGQSYPDGLHTTSTPVPALKSESHPPTTAKPNPESVRFQGDINDLDSSDRFEPRSNLADTLRQVAEQQKEAWTQFYIDHELKHPEMYPKNWPKKKTIEEEFYELTKDLQLDLQAMDKVRKNNGGGKDHLKFKA